MSLKIGQVSVGTIPIAITYPFFHTVVFELFTISVIINDSVGIKMKV